MSEKVRPSYDQHIEKGRDLKTGDSKNESGAVKAARKVYAEAKQKLAIASTDDPDYDKLREAKRVAGVKMHDARTEAEASYYAEEVSENVEVITKMKEDQAKNPPMK